MPRKFAGWLRTIAENVREMTDEQYLAALRRARASDKPLPPAALRELDALQGQEGMFMTYQDMERPRGRSLADHLGRQADEIDRLNETDFAGVAHQNRGRAGGLPAEVRAELEAAAPAEATSAKKPEGVFLDYSDMAQAFEPDGTFYPDMARLRPDLSVGVPRPIGYEKAVEE